MMVSGLLVLPTLTTTFVFTLMNGEWIGLAVAMVAAVAVLGFAWVLSPQDCRDDIRAAALGPACFLRVAERRIDHVGVIFTHVARSRRGMPGVNWHGDGEPNALARAVECRGDAQSSARLSRIGRPRPRELLGGGIGPAILAPTHHAVTQMTAP